ncbi:hypothetical protein GT354_10680 [Streptomyces sp. SID3343]|nr:hypothetical protein [Streptomyces sp. SID3343]
MALISAPTAAVQAALLGRYGFHRDELYFLVAGRHLAWGYVDQPPLTPLTARAATALFGDSPQGLRIPAVLAYVATVWLVALIAREFGAGRGAQVLAAGCAAASGIVLGVGHLMSTATFDIPGWLLVSWLVLRVLRTDDDRWWVGVGAAVGFAMFNKYLVAYLVVALLVGLFAVGPRTVLRGRWFAGGVVVAVVLSAPGLIWQATHDWPQLTVASGISSDDGVANRVMFVPLQLAYLSPLFVPIWVAGGLRLWRDREIAWARSIVPAYGVLCVLVVGSGGKPYYALPLLLVLLAAGCEPVLRWARSAHRGRAFALGTVMALAAGTGVVISLPVLPPAAVDKVVAINPEQGEQIGWPALADAAAAGWAQIPPERRARAVLFAGNYGEAGALDRYGHARGLPKPYSGHMSFADWGPPPETADGPVLVVHVKGATTARPFTDCRVVARVDNGEHLDNEEQDAVVELCTGVRGPWSRVWPSLRHFY